MQPFTPSLPTLFKQLGLDHDAISIDKFVSAHSPLTPTLRLADAFFWTQGQAEFLRDQLLDDADWAVVVDQLDVLMRTGKKGRKRR